MRTDYGKIGVKDTLLSVFAFWSLLSCLLVAGQAALSQTLSPALTPAEAERLSAEKEAIGGAYPGLLVSVRDLQSRLDGKYSQPYRAACVVYTGERVGGSERIKAYGRRFVVAAPDAEALPLAKRVARLLLLLHGQNRERLKTDHAANERTLEVWLTRQVGDGLSPDTGGEQFKNQIYLYDYAAARKPVEWAREVAHEYGHYALPGVSGFKEPEDWANGVLGERLFLKWLRDDLNAGRLRAEDIPFVTPQDLEEFHQRQIVPLIRRIAREGADERFMKRTDAGGMNYYTGFVLYLDSVYGSRGLKDALSYTEPARAGSLIQAADFLRGATAAFASMTEFSLAFPMLTKESRSEAMMVYLPRGEFSVTSTGSVRGWQLSPDAKGVTFQKPDSVRLGTSGWRRLTITLSQSSDTPISLLFRRRGVDIE